MGWRKRHSLWPAKEYTLIVHRIVNSIVFRGVSRVLFDVIETHIPWKVKGSAVVKRMGIACVI
jgi:hypothetical protein